MQGWRGNAISNKEIYTVTIAKEAFIGVRLLTVPCSEGRGGSMDGYRHNMVTLISVGEVNVVETLHRL